MNTEQAYINGFVKRASEYGVSQRDALDFIKSAARGDGMLSAALGHSLKSSPSLRGLYEIPARGSSQASEIADLLRKVIAGKRMDQSDPANVYKWLMPAQELADKLRISNH